MPCLGSLLRLVPGASLDRAACARSGAFRGEVVLWKGAPRGFAVRRGPVSLATQVDDRRLEVVANGLPLWNGQQLAVSTT